LLEPLRHIHNPAFGGVIFRRTTTQIKVEGGLWDTAGDLYPLVSGRGLGQSLTWGFPSGAKIKFAHMEHEKNRLDWQGSQIPFIGFDELTHFTEKQFWYMVGRNRSTSGIAGYIRATTNPDPDSWVRKFIAWWIDDRTGLPNPKRAGVIRWFVRHNDEFVWGFEREELVARFGAEAEPKSVTFIPASVFDNKILLLSDPSYLANLKALPLVEREQLLNGNWNVRPSAGMFFKRHYFGGFVEAAPAEVSARVRFWDRAAGEQKPGKDPDSTATVKLSRDLDGVYYIEHFERMFATPLAVDRAMVGTARQDGTNVSVGYQQDPGSAGVNEARSTAVKLDGFNVRYETKTGDKQTRCKPVSAQAEAGNIKMVKGPWNDDLLRELENFPEGRYDDGVDALTGAYEMIALGRVILVA
jgi:predicted phage terminase large subunit-like protein